MGESVFNSEFCVLQTTPTQPVTYHRLIEELAVLLAYSEVVQQRALLPIWGGGSEHS